MFFNMGGGGGGFGGFGGGDEEGIKVYYI